MTVICADEELVRIIVPGPPGPSGGGGVSDGDKGDIVVSGGGTTWMIDPTVLTPFMRSVLDDPTSAAALASLGAVPLVGNVFLVQPGGAETWLGIGDDHFALDWLDPTLVSLTWDLADFTWYNRATNSLETFIADGIGGDDTVPQFAIKAAIANFAVAVTGLTAAPGDNSTKFATTAYVLAALAASPGVPDGDKGDITVALGVWTIDPGVVTNAKLANMATATIKGRNSSTGGAPQDMTVDASLAITAAAVLQRAALTGDVTATAGSNATTIANLAVTTAKIAANAVDNTKLADMAQNTIRGRVSASLGDPEDLTAAQAVTVISSGSGGGSVNFLRADGTWSVPPGTGGIADGDKGDITVTGGVWTIDPNVVTYAKMQDVSAASRLLGRGSAAGAGDPQEMTVGTSMVISGTILQRAALTGDVTAVADGNATTIAINVVDNTKLADMATARFKGRITAATGDPEDLTGTQATSLLDVFTTSLKGVVPGSGGGTANFLRADGTWVAPPTGGVTDGDKGDITVSGGGTVWTIDPTVVTYGKIQNTAAASVLIGRGSAAGAGSVQELTAGTSMQISGTVLGRAALTGDVTATADSNATTIAALAVTTGKLADDAVTNAKLANMATSTIKGRITAATGDPEDLTAAQVLTITGAAPLASPVFTGDPQAPTPATADNDTSIATTAFVKAQAYAPLANPVFTGDPQAPTPLTADNDTSIATTAFVKAQAYAPLASPALTGTPTVPTAAAGTNTTQAASTAFVAAGFEKIGTRTAINTQTVSYTLVLGDAGKVVEMNAAGALNLTVPPNSSVAFPLSTWIDVSQFGAGQVTIVAGAGVTLRSAGGLLKTRLQYSGLTLVKRGTDEWYVFGDLG
jgi:hypothetical protein